MPTTTNNFSTSFPFRFLPPVLLILFAKTPAIKITKLSHPSLRKPKHLDKGKGRGEEEEYVIIRGRRYKGRLAVKKIVREGERKQNEKKSNDIKIFFWKFGENYFKKTAAFYSKKLKPEVITIMTLIITIIKNNQHS